MGQLYRFRQRQRRRRQWLSFDEIADWCARIPRSLRRDEAVRAQAYADLQEAMLAGEFGHGADSRVRYFQLDPGPIKARRQLEPERLRIWLDFYGANDSVIITEIFSRCWLPRDLARRWFERHGLSWPAHFEAASESELGTGACCGDVVQEDRRAKELDKSIPANKPIRGGKMRICELGALGIPADDALDDMPAPSKPPDRGPAEARMPESRPIHQWPTGEFKKRRLGRRADIEAAIDWCLVDRAIEFVARRRDISHEGAWDAIKLDISLGKLPAQCIDDRGERVAFAPHWIELLAKFQLPTEPGTLDQPIGTVGEFSRFSDFPSGGILWFDRRRAVENRLARKITEDNRAEPSLPPIRVRDVVVDERRLDELYPEEEGLGPDRKLAEAQAADRGDPRRSRAPNGAVTVARRRGPKPGTVDRYGEADRALFPEVERIMREDRVTASAAALKLAEGGVEGKNVEGFGTPKSRAKRLTGSYLKKREPETR
jgi:hypothetical protein